MWFKLVQIVTGPGRPQLYSYQRSLPRLPVPKLKDTCRRVSGGREGEREMEGGREGGRKGGRKGGREMADVIITVAPGEKLHYKYPLKGHFCVCSLDCERDSNVYVDRASHQNIIPLKQENGHPLTLDGYL